MRAVSAAFGAELVAGRICRAVKVTQADATVWGVTNHDKALTFGGLTYDPLPGDLGGKLHASVGTQVDNQAFGGAWVAGTTDADLIDGVYDDAQVEAMLVAWALSPPEAVTIYAGNVGSPLTWDWSGFQADVLDAMSVLTQTLGATSQPGCPYVLGDARCGVNLAPYQVAGTVTNVSATRTVFTDSGRAEAADWFTDGDVTFTSGANAGRTYTIDAFAASGQFTLQLPALRDVAIGDTYVATPGCDKTPNAGGCVKFANRDRFGGDPFTRGETQVAAES